MELVLAFDANFLQPFFVTAFSIVRQHPGVEIRFHLLTKDLSQEDKSAIEFFFVNNAGPGVTFLQYDIDVRDLIDLPVNKHINVMTYARLVIYRYLPPQVTKCLYVDCDVICLGDLTPLYHQPFHGHPLVVVAEKTVPIHITKDFYFNAGVLLVDLAGWRLKDYTPKMLKFATEVRSQLIFWDQDLLNLFFDKVKSVDVRYNYTVQFVLAVFPSWYWWFFRKVRPVFFHFNSGYKPWNKAQSSIYDYLYYDLLREIKGVDKVVRKKPTVKYFIYRLVNKFGLKPVVGREIS